MGVVAALGVGGRLIGRVAALGWVGEDFFGVAWVLGESGLRLHF